MPHGGQTGDKQSGEHKHEGVSMLENELRQMVAALEEERQALATLDLDGLVETRLSKEAICERISSLDPAGLSADTRELAMTARRLNDVNRRVRNLLAANVEARLSALCPQSASGNLRLSPGR